MDMLCIMCVCSGLKFMWYIRLVGVLMFYRVRL